MRLARDSGGPQMVVGFALRPRPRLITNSAAHIKAEVGCLALVAIFFLSEVWTRAHLNKGHFYTKLGFWIRRPLVVETPEEFLASKWNDALVGTVCK
jgi:hypothetical protein